MSIQDILNARLLKENSVYPNSYKDYIMYAFFEEDSEITQIYPRLHIIDSHNLETFWIDSGNYGEIVLDLHLLELIHFFSMINYYKYCNNFTPNFTTIICSYVLANHYLVKGMVEESLFYLEYYIHSFNTQQIANMISYNGSSKSYELQLFRAVQIHFILLHEFGHIQYRKKAKNKSLLDFIKIEANIFNDFAQKVNNYDISSIEHILIKYKDLPPPEYYSNAIQECEKFFDLNQILARVPKNVLKAVIENYYQNSKMDLIDIEKDLDIIEECYCDLYAVKTILDNFYFTANCLSIENYKLITDSVLCATTCIDIVNTVRNCAIQQCREKDKTLLRKVLFRKIYIKLIYAYYKCGKWKGDLNGLVSHFGDFYQYNELIYRFCFEFLLFARDNYKVRNHVNLFSQEWYRLKKYILQNLKMPFYY